MPRLLSARLGLGFEMRGRPCLVSARTCIGFCVQGLALALGCEGRPRRVSARTCLGFCVQGLTFALGC